MNELIIKKVLNRLIQQAEKINEKQIFYLFTIQRILPLLKKIYPEICIASCYPVICEIYPNSCPQNHCSYANQNHNEAENERILKIFYNGGLFSNSQIQEQSIIQLRNSSLYKQKSFPDELKIIYQYLRIFEKICNEEFRDYLRKKILYSSNPLDSKSKYQNKTKQILCTNDTLRDLTLLNLKMENAAINTEVKLQKSPFKIEKLTTRTQLQCQSRIEFDKSFFGTDILIQPAIDLFETRTQKDIIGTPKNIVDKQKSFSFSQHKILEYIKAITSQNILSFQKSLDIEPLTIYLDTDETTCIPKTLYLCIDWGEQIIEKFILWNNDKINLSYSSYFLAFILNRINWSEIKEKPHDYHNFKKYLNRLGLQPFIQTLFGITNKIGYPKAQTLKKDFYPLPVKTKKQLFNFLKKLKFDSFNEE